MSRPPPSPSRATPEPASSGDLVADANPTAGALVGVDPAAVAFAAPSVPPPTRTIGGYRIVRQIGEGGMGVVYEAEQTEPRRAVALKVMRPGQHLDEQQVRLFRRETEALGRLRHRGIAAIYEAGQDAGGQPFFVMELVRGVPLRTYLQGSATAGPPSLSQRLHVFLAACEAVAYAHLQGVVHRDLKPSNLLVTDEETMPGSDAAPGVKVLDFGLALVADPEAEQTELTTDGQLRGTLGYMSPEQIRGDRHAVGPGSDVYSLGVILYELVTGRLPYEVHWRRLPEAIRAIAEEPPLPPSVAWKARHGGSARLDPDLETIVLKALEKDPRRRYATATALADDILRFLASRPILARPPTAAYQLRKLVSRHRLAAALLAALFTALAGLVLTMAVQSRRIARERDVAAQARAVAERERVVAEQATAFMVDLFRVSNPSEARGSTVTAREILDRGAEKIERGLQDQPDVQSRLLDTMASVYSSLGLHGRAVAQRRQNLDVLRRTRGAGDPEVGIAMDLLGDELRYHGDYAEAEELFRRALAVLRPALGPDHLEIARVLNNYGLLHSERGDPAAAVPLYREALAMRRRVAGPRSAPVANSLNNLALARCALGDAREAETLFAESVAIRVEVLGDDHPFTWNSRNNLARAQADLGRLDEAEALLRRVLEARRRLLGPAHPDLAYTLESLGEVEREQGRSGDALAFLQESVSMARTLGPHPQWSTALRALGVVLHERGALAEAEDVLQEAVRLRTAPGPDPIRAEAMTALGLVRVDRGAARAAEPLLRDAVAMLDGRPDPLARAQVALGACLIAQKRPAEAGPLLRTGAATLLARRPWSRDAQEARRRLTTLEAAPRGPQP